MLIVYTVQNSGSVKAQCGRAVHLHSENKTKKRKYDRYSVNTRGYSTIILKRYATLDLVGKTDWLSVYKLFVDLLSCEFHPVHRSSSYKSCFLTLASWLPTPLKLQVSAAASDVPRGTGAEYNYIPWIHCDEVVGVRSCALPLPVHHRRQSNRI